MEFNSDKEVQLYLNQLSFLDMGSQGACYHRKSKNDVLKIFHGFNQNDYTAYKDDSEILRFSNIKNKTFIWPAETISSNNVIIGYISPYIKANNLYSINPLSINLNTFNNSIIKTHDDIKLISQNGVMTFDMMYNSLYNKNFYIIDSDEYSFSDKDPSLLEEKNKQNFNYEIYYFLVDNYFNTIVNDNKQLSDLYKYKKEDVLMFIKLLRNRLSELSGKDIVYLKDANKYIDNTNNGKYLRFSFKNKTP